MPPRNKKRASQNKRKRSTSAAPPKLPPEIVAQLNEIWDKKTKKKKGKSSSLPTSVVMRIMTEDLGLDVEEHELVAAGRDDDNDETMDRNSFLQFAGRRVVQKEQATRAFQLFDTNDKGVVVLEDVERVADRLGESLEADELEEMVALIDNSGGDGLLTLSDFIQLAKTVRL